MNNVSTIEVKDINSVKKYASQYTNGEQITLITKDGTKYFTDGKGGYFLLNASHTSTETPEEPAESPLVDKLKILAENIEVLKLLSKDEAGNLLFNGKVIGASSSEGTVQSEVTAEQFNSLKNEVDTAKESLTNVKENISTIQTNITDVESEITSVKEKADTIEATANAAATKDSLEEIKTEVSAIKEDVSTAKNDISNAKQNIETIITDTQTVTEDVTKLKSHVHKNAEGENTGEIVYPV